MPELPEVEHAAACLRDWLAGRRIDRVEADASRVLRGVAPATVARRLRGRELRTVRRRGKYLLLGFDGDIAAISHLGMTGKWVRRAAGEPPPAHSRVRVHVGDSVLHYVDPRMFGRLTVHRGVELDELPEVRVIGPDPLHDPRYAQALAASLSRTRRAVKVALMDPRVVAGIGNILATEALFRARIHPQRPADSLTKPELSRLWRGIASSIKRSMRSIGDEEISYQSDGDADNPFLVYGRLGQMCPRCRTELESSILGGRTSVYCPRCQPIAIP
jgi:formamidopyrimidine-DNA glycosylase